MISHEFTKYSARQLNKLPKPDQERIIKYLEWVCQQSELFKYAKKLKVPGKVYRFVVWPYRIIFDFEESNILVLLVGHRKDIYPKLKRILR